MVIQKVMARVADLLADLMPRYVPLPNSVPACAKPAHHRRPSL